MNWDRNRNQVTTERTTSYGRKQRNHGESIERLGVTTRFTVPVSGSEHAVRLRAPAGHGDAAADAALPPDGRIPARHDAVQRAAARLWRLPPDVRERGRLDWAQGAGRPHLLLQRGHQAELLDQARSAENPCWSNIGSVWLLWSVYMFVLCCSWCCRSRRGRSTRRTTVRFTTITLTPRNPGG